MRVMACHDLSLRLHAHEARDFLAAHPQIEAFDIVLTDANGIGRGKIIRRHELKGSTRTAGTCRSRSSASTSSARTYTRRA